LQKGQYAALRLKKSLHPALSPVASSNKSLKSRFIDIIKVLAK